MNENTNTSTNERDTHFQRFAELLLKEIEQAGAGMSPQDYSPYRFEKVRRDVIAQRTYDLVYFLIESRYAHKGTFRGEIRESISMLPDMTELPTPPQQSPS